MSLIPCSVQMLTRNSAARLRPCLTALSEVDEIIIQDGRSTDETAVIASSFPNVTFLSQDPAFLDGDGRITDFASMRNIAIKKAHNPWILIVDADEVLTKDFMDEVRAKVQGAPAVYDVFRRFYVDGEKIDYCAGYPAYQIRLFHTSCVEGYKKSVHERLVLRPDVKVHHFVSELPEVLAPLDVIRRKNAGYMALELERLHGASCTWWVRGILLRNLRSALFLTLRVLMLRLIPKKGKRMPLAYEFLHIKQLLLLIPRTCPLFRR